MCLCACHSSRVTQTAASSVTPWQTGAAGHEVKGEAGRTPQLLRCRRGLAKGLAEVPPFRPRGPPARPGFEYRSSIQFCRADWSPSSGAGPAASAAVASARRPRQRPVRRDVAVTTSTTSSGRQRTGPRRRPVLCCSWPRGHGGFLRTRSTRGVGVDRGRGRGDEVPSNTYSNHPERHGLPGPPPCPPPSVTPPPRGCAWPGLPPGRCRFRAESESVSSQSTVKSKSSGRLFI